MTKKLLPLIPPHRIYVEVFGGGASLLFAKEPSPVEVYNDIDSGLVNFFRVLRDQEKFERFYRLASLTPYSREEYTFCCDTWQDCTDEIERAYRFFVLARMSFGGRLGSSWGFAVTASTKGMAVTCSGWLSALDNLPQISRRLMAVQIEHSDWRFILYTYDTPDTFFYLDPPYPLSTRSGGSYKHEMTIDEHASLVDNLLDLRGNAMLSCYWHKVYQPLLDAGWNRIDFDTACFVAGKTRKTGIIGTGAALAKQPRTETVLLSPRMNEGTSDEILQEEST